MGKQNEQNKQQGKDDVQQKLEDSKSATLDNGGAGDQSATGDSTKPADPAVSGEGTEKLDDKAGAESGADGAADASGAGASAPAAPVEVAVVERGGAIVGTVVGTGEIATQEQLSIAINEKAKSARGLTSVSSPIDEAAFQTKAAETPVSFWENQGLSQASESQMRRLEEYITFMNPRRPVTIEEGISQQRALYRLFIWVFNSSPDEDFKKLWQLVLDRFSDLRDGVFHESNVGRFPEHLNLAKEEITTFYSLINLFKIMTDEKGAALRLKQIDLNKALTSQITEQGKQRVLAAIGK